MNFKQLEYFCAVAECKSISNAARSLHVAQPPISRQIALLEDELGVCLFTRSNKGVELTEAGQSLYEQSQHMFQRLRMIVDSVRDVNAGVRGQLKIGILYSNAPVVLELLQEYHKQFPQVELYIRLGSPKDLLDDLNHGNLHVLFLRGSTDGVSGLHEKVLGDDPVELVLTQQLDPCPEQEEIPIACLQNIPMCLLRSDDLFGYSNHLLSECQRQGITPNVVCRCYDTPMAMQLVQAGFGVSFLPRSIVDTMANPDIYAKPIAGIQVRSYPTLVWSTSLYYPSCAKSFLAMAQQFQWQ